MAKSPNKPAVYSRIAPGWRHVLEGQAVPQTLKMKTNKAAEIKLNNLDDNLDDNDMTVEDQYKSDI